MCAVNPTLWTFPTVKFENVDQQIESCEVSLNVLEQQVQVNQHHSRALIVIHPWSSFGESFQNKSCFSSSLQVNLSSQSLPQMLESIKDLAARLEPHRYLHHRGLFSALALPQLVQGLTQLETDVGSIRGQLNDRKTQKLSIEVKPMMWEKAIVSGN